MKQIKLKVIKRDHCTVYFYISKQTEIEEYFGEIRNGDLSGNTFLSSNGCSLVSCIHPQVSDVYDTLYVRGERKDLHKMRMSASVERFERIKFAVDEYNEHFKGE